MTDWSRAGTDHLTNDQFIALLEADANRVEAAREAAQARGEEASDVCAFCGEPGTDAYGGDDVLAEFWDEKINDSVQAHGQCGLDHGLELA